MACPVRLCVVPGRESREVLARPAGRGYTQQVFNKDSREGPQRLEWESYRSNLLLMIMSCSLSTRHKSRTMKSHLRVLVREQ